MEQNEAQEGPEVRGNETQESQRGTKGEQSGDKRSKEGFNSAQEDSKGKQKEAKRAKGGARTPPEGQEGGKRGADR